MKDKQFWMVIGGLSLVFLIYWFAGHPFFNANRVVMFIAIVAITATLLFNIRKAQRGEEFYLRPIPGLKAVEEAVGRSTEMGKTCFVRSGNYGHGPSGNGSRRYCARSCCKNDCPL